MKYTLIHSFKRNSSSCSNERAGLGNPQLASIPEPLLNPYVTKKTLGKAIVRSRKLYLISPRKNIAVITGLASYVCLNLESKTT